VALLDLDVVFRIATWILVSWDSTVLLEPNDLCHTMYHNSIVLLPYYVTRSKISRVGTAFMCHTTIYRNKVARAGHALREDLS
jgi:hypothetical protein